MQTRVAVPQSDTKMLAAVEKAAAKHDLLVQPLASGDEVKPGTAAVLANDSELDAALQGIAAIAAEHVGLLELLADAVDCREGIPFGSAARVRDHAARFAEALELEAEDRLTLERGALLRDIGKVRIPNDILLKKSVLNYDEWVLLQGHSGLGAELLEERGICQDVADVVRSHHECWDGDGYPQHLEGEAIPRLARIMRLVDVYCAMTSPRHYRSSTATHEEAIDHILSERGKHFDPDLVDVFVDTKIGHADD